MTQKVLLDEANNIVHHTVCYRATNRGEQMAAAIRYVGCYYRCPFCFAAGFSHNKLLINRYVEQGRITEAAPSELAHTVLALIREEREPWLLLTGGATLFDSKRAAEVIQLLAILNRELPTAGMRVIFQTNGATLCKDDLYNVVAQISELTNLRILLEQSIKGTNPKEFSLLTGTKQEGYKWQLAGYKVMCELSDQYAHITHRARLGIGPHPISLIFTYPNQPTRAMFTEDRWCSDFKRLFEDQMERYGYMGMEVLNVVEGGLNAVRFVNIPAIEALADLGIVTDRTKGDLYKFPLVCSGRSIIPDGTTLTEVEMFDLDRQHAEIYRLFTPIYTGESYAERQEFGSFLCDNPPNNRLSTE